MRFGQLPHDSPVRKNCYPPVNEALKIEKTRTNEFHIKSNRLHDRNYEELNFDVRDLVIYEEFKYTKTRKPSPTFNGPYQIFIKLSDVNFEINRSNFQTYQSSEKAHASKLRPYNAHVNFKLCHEIEQSKFKTIA